MFRESDRKNGRLKFCPWLHEIREPCADLRDFEAHDRGHVGRDFRQQHPESPGLRALHYQ